MDTLLVIGIYQDEEAAVDRLKDEGSPTPGLSTLTSAAVAKEVNGDGRSKFPIPIDRCGLAGLSEPCLGGGTRGRCGLVVGAGDPEPERERVGSRSRSRA